MINLNIEEVISAVKIINLDIEISAKKIMIALVFKINNSDIYMTIILINQDIVVPFQIVALEFEIRYLGIIIFLIVSCLIDVVTKEQYSWLFYYKCWQFCW